MNVNLNKKSVKQDGGPSHTMPDGSVMPGATHGESMAPPQQEVDPAIQEVGQYFAQAVQQGSKPEEVIMTLLEQQVDQNIIAQALMMVGYEENELQQLFQTVQELSQPQQASGPEVTRDPQELARNEAIAAEQEGLDVAIEEVDIAKSGIEIKPENKGKFTAWAKARGMSVKEAYTKVMANTDAYPPRIVKMANFAKNAAGFKKQEGGGTDYTEGVRQREGSYNAPNRKYTLDPRFKQEGGEKTPEMIEYLKALEFNKEARQAIGTNDLEKLKLLGLSKAYNNNDLAGDFSELQKLRQAAGLGLMEEASILLPHVGQQLRGGFNQILGTNFEEGGEFKPHFMYKGKRKIRAKDMETHLRLKEAGYNHDAPKAQDGDEIAKAQLIDDKSQGTLRNELFFTPNVNTEGFDLGKVGNTLLKGYNDMFSGDNNNDGINDGSFRDWNKKYANQIINDAQLSYTPDLSKENINNTAAWFKKFMLENPDATKEEAKTALKTGLSSNNSIDMSSLVQQYGDDRLLNLQTKLKGIGNNILDAGKPVVEDVKNFVEPIINNVKGKIEDFDFSQIGNFFQIGGEADALGYIPNFEDLFNPQTNYIEDTQNVRDAQLQNQNPGMGATPLQQKQGQSETTSNDLLKKINFGSAKVENLGGVEAAINRGINSPAATAIGDVADFAVQGIGIANDYLEYGNTEEAERNNRAEVYADNLAPVYTNPFNNRGTTDVNTGLMGSEGDRTTGLYAKKGGGVNNAGFKALPAEAQANILQNMAYGGSKGEAAYLANRDAVIKSAMGKAQDGEEVVDDREEISLKAMTDLRNRIKAMQERNKEEEERVAGVISRVPNEAKKLDKADEFSTLFGPNGTSGMTATEFYESDYYKADNRRELQKAISNLPQAIKDVLPDDGKYNLGIQGAYKDGSFNSELSPTRELYCTPYGCFPYQEAGADDLSTIGGNYTFVEDSQSEKLPFKKINKSERQIGDMQILYNNAPRNYSDKSQGYAVRPHHTTIYNGQNDSDGGFGGWNAEGGNRLAFNESYWNANEGEVPEYYRYVGNTRQNNRELNALENEFGGKKIMSVPELEMKGIQPLEVMQDDYELIDMIPRAEEIKKKNFFSRLGFEQGGETVNVNSALLAKLIAAGADIEIL